MFAGTVVAYGLWAVLGVGLGALVRDQALAIAAALITLLLVEPILGSVREGLLGPFAAAQALQASQLGAPPAASQGTGLLVLAGYATCLVTLGLAAFTGRSGVPR